MGNTLRDKLRKVAEKVREIPTKLTIRPWQVFIVEKTYDTKYLDGYCTIKETEIIPIPKITELNCGTLFNNTGAAEYEELKIEGITKQWFADNSINIPSGGYSADEILGESNTDRTKSRLIYFKLTGENFGPDYYEVTAIHKLENVTSLIINLRKICHA
jgi:hypothetical protein